MKYLISNFQYNLLTEISRTGGHYHTEPVFNIFDYFNETLKKREKVFYFKKYFEEKLGYNIKDDKKSFIEKVLDYFVDPEGDTWPEKFKSKDAISGFVYFLAKKFLNLNEKYGLEYVKVEGYEEVIFYFFDPYFKIFVGKIAITKIYYLPREVYKVSVSATDSELINKGYGTKMYLNVINNVEYLASDKILFSGAYRMWKHILPKYVNVWGVEEKNNKYQFTKIEPNFKKTTSKFNFFIASKNNNI